MISHFSLAYAAYRSAQPTAARANAAPLLNDNSFISGGMGIFASGIINCGAGNANRR